MRGLTVAIAAGAVVLIVAVALLMRTDQAPTEPRRAAPAGVNATKPAGQPMGRSERVTTRLDELRQDFERRQLGGMGKPEAKKREAPTASARRMADLAAADDGEDEEDPEELEELRVTLFESPDPDERVGAVLMLTGDEGPESLRMLMQAMDDPDPEVRLAVVEALGDRAEDLQPQALTQALRDPDAEVRFEAVSILGDMENPEALEMVRDARNDPDEDVRSLAEGIIDFAEDNDDEPAKTAAPQQPQPRR